jgi:hypothetical protein
MPPQPVVSLDRPHTKVKHAVLLAGMKYCAVSGPTLALLSHPVHGHHLIVEVLLCAKRQQEPINTPRVATKPVAYLNRPNIRRKAFNATCTYSFGQKFGQTMNVSQGCKQAEYQGAFRYTLLHPVMPALHSHGCRLKSQPGSRDMAESVKLQFHCKKTDLAFAAHSSSTAQTCTQAQP